MRNAFLSNRLAAVAAVFLMLAATPACNDFDEPEDAEAVVTISATALSGISLLAVTESVAVKLTLNLTARGGAAPSPFNDVIFTNLHGKACGSRRVSKEAKEQIVMIII